MSQLTKGQLQVENQNNFPDNNTNYITPALLREFNTDMIQSLALQSEVDAISSSVDGLIVSSSIYATTGSNTFNGNQTINGNVSISSSNYLDIGTTRIQDTNNGITVFDSAGGLQIRNYNSGELQLDQNANADLTITNHLQDIHLYTPSGAIFLNDVDFEQYSASVDSRLINSQGVQGTTGAQGQSGAQGVIGSQGGQGIQGVQGQLGQTGPIGIQGIQGITGTQGIQSSQGVQGIQGVQGAGANINTASFATTGSNTFTGDQIINGTFRANNTAYLSGNFSGNDVVVDTFNSSKFIVNTNEQGEVDITTPTLNVTGDIHQSGTFWADTISFYSSSTIQQTTGSYVMTYDATGGVDYATYPQVAEALQPYIGSTAGAITTGSNGQEQSITGSLGINTLNNVLAINTLFTASTAPTPMEGTSSAVYFVSYSSVPNGNPNAFSVQADGNWSVSGSGVDNQIVTAVNGDDNGLLYEAGGATFTQGENYVFKAETFYNTLNVNNGLIQLQTDSGNNATVQAGNNAGDGPYPGFRAVVNDTINPENIYSFFAIDNVGNDNRANIGMSLNTFSNKGSGLTGTIYGGGPNNTNGSTDTIYLTGSKVYIEKDTQITGSLKVKGSTYFTELTSSLATFSASVSTRINNVSGSGGAAFPYTGSALITGSLGVTGSISSTLNSTFNGVTIGIGSGSNVSNIGIGSASLAANTGTSNIGLGSGTLQNNKASSNIAIGNGALANQVFTGAATNTAIGNGVLANLGSGSAAAAAQLQQNTIIGGGTGTGMIVGARNTIIGAAAFTSADNTERNTGLGRGVLAAVGTALGSGSKYNTAIGHNAGFSLTTGSNNLLIHGGSNAGEGLASGSNNNIIGMDSGLPALMEGNTIIGRGIAGLSTGITNNVIIADGKGNVAFSKSGSAGIFTIPTDVSVGNVITASVLQLKGNAKVYFQTLTYGTSSYVPQVAVDGFQFYQSQGQSYAFAVNTLAGQYNGISGSQFAMGLQTNGSGASTFGGSNYFALISGSLSQSVIGGTEIKGGNQLANSAGGLELVYNYAYAGFAQKVYMDKGLYVSSSAGGTALTLNTNGGTAMRATGSVIITGSLSVNGNAIVGLAAGAFYSTITQSGSANVSQSMTFNNTDITEGVSVNSNSQLTVTNAGTYNIQFSAQVDRVSGSGTDTVYIWLKKNGNNVSNSATAVTISGAAAAAKTVPAWNWVVTASANDYFELVWQTADPTIQLTAATATGNIPAIPSVIATVTQVN